VQSLISAVEFFLCEATPWPGVGWHSGAKKMRQKIPAHQAARAASIEVPQ